VKVFGQIHFPTRTLTTLAFLLMVSCGGGDDGGDINESSGTVEELDYAEFIDGPGKLIRESILELSRYRDKRKFAIDRLEYTLSKAGDDPNLDFDLQLWKQQLTELRDEIRDIRKSSDNAYLLFIKTKYSPDSHSKKNMQELIEGANEASRLSVDKYRAMMKAEPSS
jgi:hypothetical protein